MVHWLAAGKLKKDLADLNSGNQSINCYIILNIVHGNNGLIWFLSTLANVIRLSVNRSFESFVDFC